MGATSIWDVNWIDEVRTIVGYFIEFGNSPQTRTFTWPRAEGMAKAGEVRRIPSPRVGGGRDEVTYEVLHQTENGVGGVFDSQTETQTDTGQQTEQTEQTDVSED